MRVFIPSKGREWLVAKNEELWADFELIWLVDDVREAQRYYRAGARRVRNVGVRGPFGKAQCINWVLRQRNLQGQWAVLADDDLQALWKWGNRRWREVLAGEFLGELAAGIEVAEERGACLVTGFNDQGIWDKGAVNNPGDQRFLVGLPRIGRAIGTCHVVKVGELLEIPVTYDDELLVTLQAIAQSGCIVECEHIYALPLPGMQGLGGHGAWESRGHQHTIDTIAREYPGLWWKGDGDPTVISDPAVVAKWREERCERSSR